MPWLVKELATAWEGMPMTNLSPYMKDLVAPFDSETLVRIKAGGMIPMGKSNAPELGWCLATEPKLYGACLNPYDPGLYAGRFERCIGRHCSPRLAYCRRLGRWRLDPRACVSL